MRGMIKKVTEGNRELYSLCLCSWNNVFIPLYGMDGGVKVSGIALMPFATGFDGISLTKLSPWLAKKKVCEMKEFKTLVMHSDKLKKWNDDYRLIHIRQVAVDCQVLGYSARPNSFYQNAIAHLCTPPIIDKMANL